MAKKRFGEFLIDNNLISPDILEKALEEQRSAMTQRFLGDILIEQQILAADYLSAILDEYLDVLGMNAEEEDVLLGNLLLEADAISHEELEHALDLQNASSGKKMLGHILVENNILTTRQLDVYLSNQARIKAARTRMFGK